MQRNVTALSRSSTIQKDPSYLLRYIRSEFTEEPLQYNFLTTELKNCNNNVLTLTLTADFSWDVRNVRSLYTKGEFMNGSEKMFPLFTPPGLSSAFEVLLQRWLNG